MAARNLLIITPDQLRADYLGCYGKADIGTSHIDTLARQGVLLEQCYCAAPLCGPSRISFATSTYMGEHNHRNYWSEISPDVPNLVMELKRRGYRTGMYGKNHLFTYSRLPEVWDEYEEICLGNYDGHPEYKHSFSSFTLEENHPFNITSRLTTNTIEFMGRNRDLPLIAWVNYQDPHPAFTCPPPYDRLFDPDAIALSRAQTAWDASRQPVRNEVWRRHSRMELCDGQALRQAVAHYMGQIRYVDDSIGRLLDYLETSGLADSTLVLFFSDHGELLGDYGMTHKLPVFYECLARIPVILRLPGREFAGRRYKGLLEEIDLAPTLLEALGIPVPPTMKGRSFLEDLQSGQDGGRESILSEAGGGAPTCTVPVPGLELLAPHMPTSFGPGAMIRAGNFKLSVYHDDSGELYDLEKDPEELHNLHDDPGYQTIRQELTLKLLKRLLGVKVRDGFPGEWHYPEYPLDVRFEPLEDALPKR